MKKGLVLWGVKSIYYVMDVDTGIEYKCLIKGKVINTDFNESGRYETTPIVTGDYVLFEDNGKDEGKIIERLKRKSEFKRFKRRGREVQTIVSNIDQLIVVDSFVSPPLRPFFIDRVLLNAELMGIDAVIVFNKYDLLDSASSKETEYFNNVRNNYEKLSYKTLVTSTLTGEGLEELGGILKNKISSLNGRSGVGKSSLIKMLVPEFKNIRIGEVSSKFNRGTHTTNYSKIYKINYKEDNFFIVDTPGIRELAIYIDSLQDLERFFRDFTSYRDNCKFSNCSHTNEPGCAVKKAVDNGDIADFRYESYLRMRETIEIKNY